MGIFVSQATYPINLAGSRIEKTEKGHLYVIHMRGYIFITRKIDEN
jgi:hypothetical protein